MSASGIKNSTGAIIVRYNFWPKAVADKNLLNYSGCLYKYTATQSAVGVSIAFTILEEPCLQIICSPRHFVFYV
jgi:hypothetical protein